MSEQTVPVAPEGSARTIDVEMHPYRATGATPQSASAGRNGAQVAILNGASSNWGLGGEAPTMIAYKSASCFRIRQGAIFSDFRIPLVCAKPPQITSWEDGLHMVGLVGAWPTNTAGKDNGLVLGFVDAVANLRPIAGLGQGWTVYNENGVLTFAMRGAVGLDSTPLTATVTEWNKILLKFRHATKDNDATLELFLNDAPTAVVTKTSADANWPAVGATVNSVINWGVGVDSATEYFNFRNVRFTRGPNSVVGA